MESRDKAKHVLPNLDQLEVHFVAFDVLHAGGECVTDRPLSERHRVLRSVVADAPPEGYPLSGALRGRIVALLPDMTFLSGHCLSKKGSSLEDIAEIFNEAISMQVRTRDAIFP